MSLPISNITISVIVLEDNSDGNNLSYSATYVQGDDSFPVTLKSYGERNVIEVDTAVVVAGFASIDKGGNLVVDYSMAIPFQGEFCNRIFLGGHLPRNPEVRQGRNGKSFTTLTLAVAAYKQETSWFNCAANGKNGEFVAQYTEKGSSLCIEGTLRFKAGEDKTFLNVSIFKAHLMPRSTKAANKEGGGNSTSTKKTASKDNWDDISF